MNTVSDISNERFAAFLRRVLQCISARATIRERLVHRSLSPEEYASGKVL